VEALVACFGLLLCRCDVAAMKRSSRVVKNRLGITTAGTRGENTQTKKQDSAAKGTDAETVEATVRAETYGVPPPPLPVPPFTFKRATPALPAARQPISRRIMVRW